jgi:hypothetical protein
MFTAASPENAIALYVLELLPSSLLPKLAENWLIQELDSPSLRILAGEKNPIMSDVGPLFEKSLLELGIPKPEKSQAVLISLKYYLELISEGELAPYEGMRLIDNDISKIAMDTHPNKKFVGDGLGLERVYTWYRELQDAQDGSMLFYYNDLPIEKAVGKFEEHLIEEARIRLHEFET